MEAGDEESVTAGIANDPVAGVQSGRDCWRRIDPIQISDQSKH
jgi:hypothetical protein